MTHHSKVLRQSVAAAANRPVQMLLPFDSRRISRSCLTNPRAVTVDSVQHFTVSVVGRREKRSSHARASTAERIYVNGKKVGLYDRLGPVSWSEMPLTIRGVRLKLSDGQECTVYNRALTVIERWESRQTDGGEKRWFPHKKTLMSAAVDLRLGRRLLWSVASALSVGDQATIEFAFQWVNGELTNGVVSFPSEYPRGQKWNFPVPHIGEAHWDAFLDGLEGKFLHELLPFRAEVVSRKPEPQPRQLTERQTAVARVVGGMWKGDNCERVSLGRNVLFTVNRQNAQPLYVVDNPGVGAVYVFTSQETARAFATGEITRQAAIKAGCRRVVHAGAWEQRLAALLAAM